jgi:hypothetical protein
MQQYNALNLRQSSNLRLALADAFENETVLLGVVIGIASIASTKVVAATQADWAWIDAEHTPYSPTLLVDMGRTFHCYGLCPSRTFNFSPHTDSHIKNVFRGPDDPSGPCALTLTRVDFMDIGCR